VEVRQVMLFYFKKKVFHLLSERSRTTLSSLAVRLPAKQVDLTGGVFLIGLVENLLEWQLDWSAFGRLDSFSFSPHLRFGVTPLRSAPPCLLPTPSP